MVIERKIESILLFYLVSGKVNILLGSRRVGKTFLLKKIAQGLSFKFLWLNAEDADVQSVLQQRSSANYKKLFADIELLIIDEAQVIANIGLILKLIIDEIPQLKVIITGSSAFDLNSSVGEPLVGRGFWHYLYPIAQLELNLHENLLETKQNLEERLIYGSYPELFQLESLAMKQRYLKELTQSYLLKDIIAFDGIRNASKIENLLRLIAFQIGKEVSMEELGKQLQLSKNTVEKYLDLLEKVFILKKITGFSRNLRKEITKNVRFYFWDNGIRNALINDFRPLANRQDIGGLWENYLVVERMKLHNYQERNTEFYFWRTYDRQEIDWVEVENQVISAFEFKWSSQKVKTPTTFATNYPEATFQVISQDNYLDFITA